MIVLVGLGNPDKIYDKTYHNIGFMAIDYFAEKYNIKFTKNKYNAQVAECSINGEKVVLLKPTTYMNLSGQSVEAIVKQLKLPLTNLCIVYDDIDLEVGNIRYRNSGSAGTHNGMRDIVNRLHSQDFPRLRIGIGKPDKIALVDYVLSKISKERLSIYENVFDNVSTILKDFIDKKGKLEPSSLVVKND